MADPAQQPVAEEITISEDGAAFQGQIVNGPIPRRRPPARQMSVLSREATLALARGAETAGTVICSGEGGVLPEQPAANARYAYEFASARFGWSLDTAARCRAFHFKAGQAAKTGAGGYLNRTGFGGQFRCWLDALVLTAEIDHQVVGYLLAHCHHTLFANGRLGWVEELMVSPEARRAGVGTTLMGAADSWAGNLGADYLALATRRAGRQLTTVSGRAPEFGPPKTTASIRQIPLPTIVAEELPLHLAMYPPGLSGLVFTNNHGQALRRSNFGSMWRRATKSASAGDVVFHHLRHYYASLLIRHGESVKTVQARMGHASATETLDTYAHLWPDSDDRTREAVDSVLRPGAPADSLRTDEAR